MGLRHVLPLLMISAACGAMGPDELAEKASGELKLGTVVKPSSHNVRVTIRIENYSKWLLVNGVVGVRSGVLENTPRTVAGCSTVEIGARKTSDSATGTSGAVRLTVPVDDGANTFAVMWSVPYNQNWDSNTLAVHTGPVREFVQDMASLAYDMYYDDKYKESRREYYYDVDMISAAGAGFTVFATMDTTHRSTVVVRVVPHRYEDLGECVQRVVHPYDF